MSALYALGLIAEKNHNDLLALHYFEQLRNLFPDNVAFLSWHGLLLNRMKRYPEVIKNIEPLLTTLPKDRLPPEFIPHVARASGALASAKFQQGLFLESRKYQCQALALDPQQKECLD
jgi:tetratricopeptide (TPR) repeat protein